MKICNKNKEMLECHFSLLQKEDIDKMVDLENEIAKGLENKKLYSKSGKEDFIKIYENYNSKFLGLKINNSDEIIAMGVYVKFENFKENYGYDLDINENELQFVGNIESTVVKENFRGNNIQKKICLELERYALLDGIKILGATVAPENKYSLKNFMDLGYDIYDEKIKYGSFNRYILKKEIS